MLPRFGLSSPLPARQAEPSKRLIIPCAVGLSFNPYDSFRGSRFAAVKSRAESSFSNRFHEAASAEAGFEKWALALLETMTQRNSQTKQGVAFLRKQGRPYRVGVRESSSRAGPK